MKLLLIAFYFLFSSCSVLGQKMDYSDTHKLDDYASYLGENENCAIYRSKKWSTALNKYSNVNEEYTLVKIPLNDGEIESYKIEIEDINDKKVYLVRSYLIGGRLIELHYVNARKKKEELYLVERNLDDFSIKGEPILVSTHEEYRYNPADYNSIVPLDVRIYKNNDDFVVLYGNYRGVNKPYLKKFDLNRELIWTKDLSPIYSEKIKNSRIQYDKDSKVLFFELDLSECTDCGFFQRNKVVDKAEIVVYSIDDSSEERVFKPEVEEGLVL